MRTITRYTAIAAPFIVVFSLASVGFAEEPDLMEPISPNAHAEDLNVDALGLGPDQAANAETPTLTTGVAVSLGGATGSGPSLAKSATGNWRDEPVKP